MSAPSGHLPELPVLLRKQERLTKNEAERVANYIERIKRQKKGKHSCRA